MKLGYYWLFIAFVICSVTNAQQITTNTSISLEDLILNYLAEGCVEISNITSSVNGTSIGLDSYGLFQKANSNFPFEDGIILTTGNASSAGNMLISNQLHEGTASWGSDSDLETALGLTGQTVNATTIEFDFVSVSNQIQFNYILASEEYFDNNPCDYADGFAFLIKEAGTADAYDNIALIPGTTEEVSTNTIHDDIANGCPAVNEEYFAGYNLGDTNYNGRTTVLSATATIQPYITYHIKLVIADFQDQNFDSAVFIEGNSFSASVDLGPDISTCDQSVTLNGTIQNNQATYKWYKDGSVISGATDSTYNVNQSGTYKVEISLGLNNTSCIIEDEIVVALSSAENFEGLPNYDLCDWLNDGQEYFYLYFWDYYVWELLPPSDYIISYFLSESDALANTNALYELNSTVESQTIYVRAQDYYSNCIFYSTYEINIISPEINTPEPVEVCDDHIDDNYPVINLSSVISDVVGTNTDYYVGFHYSELDAQHGINHIDYENYTNLNDTDVLYISAYDPHTGCSSTTSVTVTVIENPDINPDHLTIDHCEIDEDGFAIFDLTSIIDTVLNGITGVTVSFYEVEEEAHIGDETKEISNPSTYENIVQTHQVVYVRVEDDLTGCHSVSSVSLVADSIQTWYSDEAVHLCDDPATPDGIVDFDLYYVEAEVAKYWTDYVITFYETEDDQTNDTNPLDQNIPYTVDTTKVIYATIASGECTAYVTVTLNVDPAIVLPPLISLDYCDEDHDGYTSISMLTFNDQIASGVNPKNIKYYLTENDAINNVNRLPPYFRNTSNPQTVFVKVTNPNTECYNIGEASINILTPPDIYQPNDILVCDEDTDGISSVNLESVIPEVVMNPAENTFTFYLDYYDAMNQTNAIATPQDFNTSSVYVFARIESNLTGCSFIIGFSVFVSPVPEIIPITNYQNCEADISGVADFYFYLKDDEILSNQFEKHVRYFATEQDANDGINEIPKYDPYQNTSNPQTIYYRIESIFGDTCFGTSSFELEVGALPQFNQPTDITVCDDITNDGIYSFDFNEKLTEISDGINEDLDISFHASYYDAEYDFNELPLQFDNYVNPQQIYVRIENGTYCNAITSFIVTIIPAPAADLSPNTIIQCDADYDETVIFDLTQVDVQLHDPRTTDIVISYFTDLEDIEEETNQITDLVSFENTSNPQTIYVKVNNTRSNCYVTLPLELVVNSPPEINDFNAYEICNNDMNEFDLSTIDNVIRNDQIDIIISYHNSDLDAHNSINALPNTYTYSTTSDIIYARVQYASTGCYVVYPFQLLVNPLPIANRPNDLLGCDDVSNDNLLEFDLATQNPSILGSQDPLLFTVSYYETEMTAMTGQSELNSVYNAQNGQTIYARIENNSTGCFSTTEFDVIIYPHPALASPLVDCDLDYDGLITFDLTSSIQDLYTVVPDYIEISYFETEEDLDNDVNPISIPENYANLSNPQTVLIKAYNTIADCYSIVPLELQINLPPPINEFEIFDICYDESNIFDLSEINSVLVNDLSDKSFSYHNSQTDAFDDINPLDNLYTYLTSSDLLYARVETISTSCFMTYPFTVQVNPLPIANQPNDMEACDDDYDFMHNFRFEDQTSMILGSQSPDEFTITYHELLLEAEDDINSLDKTNYLAFDGQIIYARIENNTTGCYETTSFLTTVFRKPVVDIPLQVICLDNFPLMVVAGEIVEGDQYQWSTGEITSEINIEEIGDYTVTVTTEKGCTTTTTFNVIESEQATIEVTETVDFSDPNNIKIIVSGIGNYMYILDDGEPQESNLFEYVSLGYHTITVIDLNGCASISKEVVVVDTPKFFTPNGDGYFDTWHITGVKTLPGTSINIFDRYGKLLKVLSSEDRGWDGNYNGHPMPSTDYWFVANVVRDGIEFQLKGHFALKR